MPSTETSTVFSSYGRTHTSREEAPTEKRSSSICLFSFFLPPQTPQIIEFRAKNLIIEKDHPNPPRIKNHRLISISSLTHVFFTFLKKKKDLQDALGYIDSVKLAYLPTKPYVYYSFLSTIKLFHEGYALYPLPSIPSHPPLLSPGELIPSRCRPSELADLD